MPTTINNLGWANAGGETEARIKTAVEACNALKHQRLRPTNEGSYGTVHQYRCDECGWEYREDSGD